MITNPFFRIRTIKSALFLLVSICVIPAVVVSIAAICFYYAQTRSELVADSMRRATSISAGIDASITGLEIGLFTLSKSPAFKEKDFRNLHVQAQSVIGRFGIARNIFLIAPDGQQLMNTALPYGTTLPVTSNFRLVQQAVQTGRLVVSDVIIGSVSRSHLVAVAIPVFDNETVAYVLGATIAPADMSSLLINSHPPKDWIISAHDSQLNFVARTLDIGSLIGRPASDDMRRAMANRPAGAFEGITKEGIPVFAAFAKSSFTGWTVSVGIPKANLLSDLNNVIAAAVMFSAIAMAIGSTAAMALAFQIRKAITALVPPAEALSRSEPVALPPETFAETHAVAMALQCASKRLRQSEYEAQHDELTGLVNRSFLKAALPSYVGLCDRNTTSLAFLSIDLDGFKAVNDLYGHSAGDEVLRVSAKRIAHARRGSDVSIRMGGDEFAIVMYGASPYGARLAAEQLLADISRDIGTPFGIVNVSASIGIALYPGDAADIISLLAEADAALYVAKRSGKNRVVFASADRRHAEIVHC